MLICPKCKAKYQNDKLEICMVDNWGLIDESEFIKSGGDPLLGTTIAGRFRIIGKAGVGAMSSVYKAVQSSVNRIVALKILQGDVLVDPSVQKRFYREAKATSLLSHPNTVTVYDFGYTDDGLLYIAMEYLYGKLLSQVIEEEKILPAKRAIRIISQIALSLSEAHRKGIVHRDLKPSNIMISHIEGQEIVKVLDFGIAKIVRGENKLEVMETQDGTIFGTPRYMSPEQAQSKVLDSRSDLYSLGIIFYQLLTGHTPFEDKDAIVVMARHIKSPAVPPSTLVPLLNIPQDLENVIMKLIEKKREKRFQSAEELLFELKRIDNTIEELDNSVLTFPKIQIKSQKKFYKNKMFLFSFIGVAILAILISLFFIIKNFSNQKTVSNSTKNLKISNKIKDSNIIIKNNNLKIIDEAQRAILTLQSDPDNSQVFKEGKLLGITPLSIPVTIDEKIILQVKHNGFHSKKVNLSINSDKIVFISLKRKSRNNHEVENDNDSEDNDQPKQTNPNDNNQSENNKNNKNYEQFSW